MPRVSVIIPTHNRAALVAETIRSVQAQTVQDIEILVIDDASTDNTAEVVSQMAADDARIRLIRQPENRRVNAARNRGLEVATGQFVNFLDSDDLFMPHKLETQLRVFEQNPALDVVICQSLVFTETPEDAEFVWRPLRAGPTDHQEVLRAVLRREIGWGVLAPLWKRSFLERLGPMPENVTGGDEVEFHTRALCHQPQIAFVLQALALIRIHYVDSGRSQFHQPHKLIGRFKGRRSEWRTVRQSGLATPENREQIASFFVNLMRAMASRRMAFWALRSWGYALYIMPGLRKRLLHSLVVLPLMCGVLISGRGSGILEQAVRQLKLEYFVKQLMTQRYSEPAASHV